MNKIFRIVWSQATQSWVVVSELTKAHKKQSSSNSQGSAVKFSGNFIKSSAIALALLSGHSAYAATAGNTAGEGYANTVAFGANSKATGGNSVALGTDAKAEKNNGVAIGKGAQSTEDSAIALGFESKSTSNWSVAVGLQTKATNKQAVAVGSKSEATGENSIAIGNAAKASNESSVALGSSAESTNKYTTAVGGTAFANQEGATALGYGARATNKNTIAIGKLAKAEKEGVIALGSTAAATGDDTIAIGNSATAQKNGDIILGKDAKSRDQSNGRSIAIGQRATAGSNRSNFETNDQSTGLRADDGSVAIGTNAYTGLNKNNTAVNNSVALGAGAGVGYRSVDTDGKPLGVGTDADDNDKVLVKAFGGTTSTLNYFQNSGKAKDDNFFSFQNVDINEGTALGRNTRAIGDQSVAIGAQSVAGQGSIVIGGNDIQAYDQKKYFKAANPTNSPANTVNDYDAPTTPGTGKNGQPITISAKYKELVDVDLDRSYRASYGQDGSTVIGMQAHSTTPLGVAIGTNSIVRKGAFGSTAIGSGASVVANAEAAVAIGMGAEAQGNYAVAAGTAARAKESAVAAGYQANADTSAVAVGDSSKAVESSVAVGQLAQAKKVADIAVGQGAIASGEQGAIAMGLGTNAQGDSSIMIGGADIKSASAQTVTYQKATGGTTSKDVTEKINGEDVTRHYSFSETKEANGSIADAYKELTGLKMETDSINFADAKNKNGHASTSLGVHALSKGDLGTAIGASSRADAIGSVALGVGAHATRQNAVAIGTGSTTDLVGSRQLSISYDKDGKIVDDNSPNKAYTFNWAGGTNTAEGDVVSFGSSGAERQLKNVAAGRVADDSTDAINGSQLHSIAKKVALGWNIAGDPKTKVSGIGADDQVNFVNGNGTTVTVTKQEEVKNGNTVTTAKGANVKFDVKAADGSITSNASGISVNTDDATIGKTPDGKLKANTGTINTGNDGKAAPNTGDGNKLATVDTVVNAVNKAAWTAISAATTAGELGKAATNQLVKAGDKVTFEADKNIKITQAGSKFTFATRDDVSFNTVQVGGDQGPKLSKTDDGDLKVSGLNGTDPVKVTNVKDGDISANSQDAINGSQFHKLANNTIQLKGQTGTNAATETEKQALNKENGIAFTVKSSDGTLLEVSAAGDTITLTPKTGTITTGTDGVPTADTTGGKLVTADQLVKALTSMGWKATADNDGTGTVEGNAEELIKAGETVTFKAGNNLAIKQAGKNFIYSLQKDLTGLTSAEFKNQAGDKTVINGDGMTITPKDAPANPVSLTKDGLDNGGKTIKNVTSGLTNYPAGTPKGGLVDLSKPATGTPVPDTTAATVGDLRNMGWVVSSDKTTGELTKAYTDQVKNADEVKFVGEGGVTVSGKTENGIRTITVKAEAQEMPEQPVSYTTVDGTKVYPKTVTKEDGTQEVKYYSEPNGKGTEIPKENVIASINGPEGTKAPTTLSNVAGNLDGAKKDTKAPTTKHAPVNTTDSADPNYVNPNNAATVGDVLNAGWNLQNNGEARDFVKPYDTVNFVNGANTTAVVTTEDGTTSNVTYNVTGLPVTFTDKDGKPVSKIGDKYYPVNEKGQPVTPDGKPAVKTNAEGKPVTEDGTVIEPIDTAANPLKSNLVNPNVTNSKAAPNNQTTSPTQLGNVANGAETFKPADNVKLANDGKWYPADKVEPNGQPKTGAAPVEVPANIGKAGLIDFSQSNPNNAATVGDLQNLGWIVSASGNNYSDQVRNANEVKFVGEGTATVTGKTDDKGVRTITVKVDDQVSTNNAVTPVVYTDKDGNKVYPIKDEQGNVTYHTTPDGKGQGDKVVPKGDVITSVNGPEGTTSPTTLKNVKNNIPNVNDGSKTITNPDGTEVPNAGDVANINKAPLKAEQAAELANPKTKDGQPNTKYIGNNAATVSDVLNAGWNLQNNGEARDFVKPFDTVNFVNGANTTAVVTTAADGTTSNVTFNVDMVEITPESDGSVKGPVPQDLLDKLDAAQAKVDENPDDEEAKKALKAAEDAVDKAGGNKVANAQNVADMINSSGFTLKTSNVDGGKKVAGTTKDDGELINPGKTVEMVAGKNMSVKQDENGKVTYATKDDVEFNTVKIANPNGATYTDKNNNPLVKADDGKFYPADQVENGKVKDPATATPVEADKVTTKAAPSVEFKAENATPATNNTGKDKDGKAVEPTTALNISSDDGKPTQLKGVGSVLNIEDVDTKGDQVDANGNVTTPAKEAKDKLVNLGTNPKEGDKPLSEGTLNSAATVRDLANMGWVVSAKDNNYTNTVKNANKVEFKGDKGISVTGKDVTQADGTVTREITVAIADGKVTDKVTITKDGKDIPAVKIGDNYYEVDKNGKPVGYEVDEKGKPTANNKPIDVAGATITNEGNKVVTGNTVATAIQESGWNVGLADSSKANEAFNDSSKALSADKLEKVNPDDNVRFADGKNTKVQAATMDEVNKDGKKITNTYVRFNVDLPISQITSEDKDGNKVAKAADGKWYPVKEGKPDTTKEALEPSNVRTSASMDPDGLGDKYTSTTSREEGLTPTQLGELTGKQAAAAKAAEEKIKDLLKGQSKDVIEAASKAAVDAAKEEAKVQYLKDNGLDKGTGGTVISNVAWGTKPSDAVNVDQLQNSGINVHSRTVEGSTGKVISGNTSPTKVKMDETVNVDAGNNIEITRNGRDIAIATSMTPKFDSVQFGKEGPKITNKAGNINVSGPDGKTPTKITGVAPGEISATSKDAINGSQLHAVASNLNNKINKVGKHADAGTASALAAANIPQAYTPGKSLVGIAAGNYQGQNGLAVGMSRISDNGKIIIRLSGTANSQGKTGVAAGVGYQW